MKNSTFYTLIALFVGVVVLISSSGIESDSGGAVVAQVTDPGVTEENDSPSGETFVIELPGQDFDFAIEVPFQEPLESDLGLLASDIDSQYHLPAHQILPYLDYDENCHPILPFGFLPPVMMTEVADVPEGVFLDVNLPDLTEITLEEILDESLAWSFAPPLETISTESGEFASVELDSNFVGDIDDPALDVPYHLVRWESGDFLLPGPPLASSEEAVEFLSPLPASDGLFEVGPENQWILDSEIAADGTEIPQDHEEMTEGEDSNVAFAEAPGIVFPWTEGADGSVNDLFADTEESDSVAGDGSEQGESTEITVIGPVVTFDEIDQGEEVVSTPGLDGVTDATLSEEEAIAEVERRVDELRRFVGEDLQRGRWSRVLGRLKELVALRPYNADYHLTLGLVYRRLADSELLQLREDMVAEGKIESQIVNAQNEAIPHLLELDGAVRKFQEYEDFGGNEAISSLLLADVHALMGNREEAFDHLEKAASLGINIARAVRQFPSLDTYTQDTRFVRAALKLEHYEIQNEDLRDPFTGSVRRLTPGGDFQKSFTGGWTVEKQKEVLAEARQAVSRIEYALRNNEEEKAKEFYVQLRGLGSHLSRFSEPELAAEFRSILDRIDEIEEGIDRIRLSYLYELAREGTQEMERAFQEQDFPRLEELHGQVERLAIDLEAVDDEYVNVAQKVREVSDRYLERSEIVRGFRARNIRIQGIIVSDEGSQAIIENSWVAEGSSFNDVRIAKIEPTRVIFEFQGELIPLNFRRY